MCVWLLAWRHRGHVEKPKREINSASIPDELVSRFSSEENPSADILTFAL